MNDTQRSEAGVLGGAPASPKEARPHRDLPQNLRPTLVIGLGGTGHRIVAHLKARIVRAYGRVPTDQMRLLVFDVADEAITVPLDGRPLGLEPDRELIHVGNTPVPNIVRHIDRQPAIAERLPSIQAIPPVALRAGAKQVRPLGLLALLWRFDEIERRINDAIWELSGKETLGRRAGAAQGINVFVCNSLVGGTGSGMFLDVAYLVRAIFSELGSLGDFCYVTGVGVLPQAFRGIDGPNIVPNAVAALKELSHCMLKGDFSCRYPNGRWLSSPHAPFDLYYLVDGVDEQGYTWRGLNALCAMVAAGLFLQIGSQIGRKGENDFDNVDGVLAQETADGEGTFCGSFGVASLHFPAREVGRWCAARLAAGAIEHGLLRPADEEAAEEEAESLLRAHAIDVSSLLRELAQDDEGLPLAIDVRLSHRLRRAREADVIQDLIAHVHDYRRLRVDGDFHTWMKANGAAVERRWRRGVERALTASLTDPVGGVNATATSIEALDRRLRPMEVELETRQAAAEAEHERLEADLQDHAEALRRAATGARLFRGRAVAAARSRYLEVAERYLDQALKRLLAETGLALLARLRRHLVTQAQTVDALRARLAVARRRLSEEASRVLRDVHREEIGRISLADPDYCQTLYEQHAPPIEEATAELVGDAAPWAWSELSADDLVEHLRAAAAGFFQAVADTTADDVLRARAGEISPQAYRARLFRLATPSWNLDATRLQDGGAGLRVIQVMGVCDEAATVFVEDGPTLVSTHDATTVNAFLATIGTPYTALQQYGSYRRQYQAARRSRPLHVLPQFQTEDEEARLAFALAAVFGMIFSRGFYYYYRPEDALESPLKLGHGLANAIHHFARADTLTREVMGRVERRVEEIGTMVRSLRRLPDRDALHRLALGAVFLAPRPEEEAEAPSQEQEGTDRTDRRPRLTAADLLSFDDGCYLLDRVNAEGLLLAAEEGRSRLVARWLALRALTGLGAALDRMPASLAMDDPAARFDTFGVAAWAFPVASLRDHLAHRWQIEALRSLLAPFEGDRAGADAFLERQGWPPSPWPEGGTIRFRAAGREAWSTPSLRQIRTLREAIDDTVEAEQQRLRESMGQAERSLEASSSGLVAALAEEVDGLLDDHGLGLTAAFLDQLEEVAQARVTRLEKEAERCAARLAELDGRADDAARALDDLIAQFPPPRLRAALGLLLRPWRLLRLWLLYGEIEPLVGAYLSYRQSQWLLQAEGFERQWRAALVARLAQAARDEKEAVARLRTALERLRERLLGERTSASRPALERQLEAAALPGRLIDRFYEKVADDEGVKPTGLLITHGPLSRWVREGWAGETLDLILEEHAREQFAFLDWVRLDDLLARTRSGAELRDRLTALVEAAAPWWAWDESALSAAERSACRRLLLVGLPDAESSLLVDLLPDRPHTCFSTGDRRRIVAIQVVQGLPLEVANEGG